MGLSRDLRATIECIVNSCMREELTDMAHNIGNHLQRIESLETEVMRLQVRPQPDNEEANIIESEFSKIAFYIDKMDLRKGQATSVADLCIYALHELDKLEHFLLRSHDMEAIRKRGAAYTVIEDVNMLSENVLHPRWAPSHLFQIMPKAQEDADKLPNEVRVRLFNAKELGPNKHLDCTMLIREDALDEGTIGFAVPITSMPIPGGSLNIVTPAGVPTLMSRDLFWCGGTRILEAQFFDAPKWLPEKCRLWFLDAYTGCVAYHKLVELYGEHAAEVCLIGQVFIQARILPMEEARTPPADCPEQPPSP